MQVTEINIEERLETICRLKLYVYLLNATTKLLRMNMKLNVKIKGYYVSQYYLETKVSMYSPTEEMEGLF